MSRSSSSFRRHTYNLFQEGAPMEGTRPAKAPFDKALTLIAKRLRDDGESITHEKLPERWVELSPGVASRG
jgi:hypothetical protein